MTIDEAIAEIEQSGLYGNQVHQETLVLARDALHYKKKADKTRCFRCKNFSYGKWCIEFPKTGFCSYFEPKEADDE